MLFISIHEEEVATWSSTIHRVLSNGPISHAELESVVGRLSFTQTSVFLDDRSGYDGAPIRKNTNRTVSFTSGGSGNIDPRIDQLLLRPWNASRTDRFGGKGAELANQSSTFYNDNNDALMAILKNAAMPIPIQETTGPIWHRIRELNITPPFEHVQSKRNIADMHTIGVETKYKCLKRDKSRMTSDLGKIIGRAIDRGAEGLPIGPHSMMGKSASFMGSIVVKLLFPY